jgi:non-specific protein-tyrosine kinase
VVIVAALVVSGVAFLSAVRQEKVYRATSVVLLSNPDANKTVVSTEIIVLESEVVAQRAREVVPRLADVDGKASGDTRVINVSSESSDPELAAASVDAVIEAYVAYRQEQQVNRLLADARAAATKVVELDAEIDAVNSELAQALAAVQARHVPFLGESEADGELRLQMIEDESQAERARLQPTLNSLYGERLLLEAQQRDALAQSEQVGGGAEVVTPATVPTKPVRPNPARDMTLGVIVGALLGVALAFLFEQVDDRIKSRSDLDRAVGSGIPLLGAIPTVPDWRRSSDAECVSLTAPRSPAAEAYRSLRTSVQFAVLDKPMSSLLVTSASPGEGKSATVANLAVSMARTGRRVVVVDCDLRRPRIHEFFGLGNEVGVTSVMIGDLPLSEALQEVPEVPGLSLLGSGPLPPNPSELLSLRRFTELIATITASGALVLFDSPPLIPITDAAVVSARVDQVILVVSAGITSRRALRQSIDTLRQIDVPIAGVVMNRVTSARRSAYVYSYESRPRPAPRPPQRPPVPTEDAPEQPVERETAPIAEG